MDLKKVMERNRAKMQKLREKQAEDCKKFFSKAAQEVFDKHTNLERIEWRQYTPWFNDGETCVFSSQHDYPSIMLKDMEEPEEATTEYWIESKKKKNKEITQFDLASIDVIAFLSVFDDDEMEQLFGDHATVIVSRCEDGSVKIKVEECSHD